MGQSQSSHADGKKARKAKHVSIAKGAGGRKSTTATTKKSGGLIREAPHGLVGSLVSEASGAFAHLEEHHDETPIASHADDDDNHHGDAVVVVHEEDDDDTTTVDSYDDDDEEEEEEEEDEEWEERLRVLEDARNLKKVAAFFLHPETPVVSDDPAACARCYFDRPSAPQPVVCVDDEDEVDEYNRIMDDLAALKKLAKDYMHPEVGIDTKDVDPAACGRCYFDRPSAPERMGADEAEERARVLADAEALKQAAADYLHPERPFDSSRVDPAAFGRNYFERISAPEELPFDEAEERAIVLEEAKTLKDRAVDYMHPELPVSKASADPFACGRNYFARPSAEPHLDAEEADERERALADAKALKDRAVDYLHPERPVESADPTSFGRNYFDRPSAEPTETWEGAEERVKILEDAAALKKQARDFLHPELPVVTADPAACGRNYFDRPSAVAEEEWHDAEERARILEDAAALKKQAKDFLHPELPVVTTDPSACGRNFFTRPSAVPYEDEELSEEREQVLADAAALKRAAVDYMHPELPVVADSTSFARNYFNRPSADYAEGYEEAEERARVLAEAKSLKKLAVDYMHPEAPVVTADPCACGRNFYDRPSAVSEEEWEEAEERARVLAEAKSLKKLAVDYVHPEVPVVTTDACACARSYFDRPSAAQADDEEMAERRRVLAEARALKKLAVDYMHPEIPVVTSDPTACGRSYFARPSAPEQERPQYAAERARVLADARALKKSAVDYMHPEVPVVTSDPAACARNYFDRASAVPQDDPEEAAERARILADAEALVKLAVDYMHPEIGVDTNGATVGGRNYFERASALGHDHMVHTFPVHEDEAHHEDHHSEHLDHFGMDDDVLFDDIRAEFNAYGMAAGPVKPHQQVPKSCASGSEDGNLSRSPSSIMLFPGDDIYE